MNGAEGSDRIDQQRDRWRAEPSSRGFLQIAEEYRRAGRLTDAVALLDEGLKQQPGYLSALVAKGRCLLDLGQAAAARETLERAVRMDPTQPVANKLLVRAHLDAGDVKQARERLDLYGLLHGGDPEVQELAARIGARERGDGGSTGAPPAVAAAGGDVFDLPPVTLPPPRLDLTGSETRRGETEAQPAPTAAEDVFAAAPAPAAAAPANGDGEPFGGLATAARRRRYLEALAAEGIFTFPVPRAATAAAAPASQEGPRAAASPAPEEPAAAAPAPPEEKAAAFAPTEAAIPLWETIFEPPVEEETPWVPAEPAAAAADPFAAPPAEPAAETPWTPAPPEAALTAADEWVAEEWLPQPEAPAAGVAAAAAVEEPVAAEPEASDATATLGHLYLEQGHLEEAEQIFSEVVRREPDSRGGREGLEELARRRDAAVANQAPGRAAGAAAAAVSAGELLAGFRPDPARGGDTPAARKTFLLTRYLERLRRGSQPHVP